MLNYQGSGTCVRDRNVFCGCGCSDAVAGEREGRRGNGSIVGEGRATRILRGTDACVPLPGVGVVVVLVGEPERAAVNVDEVRSVVAPPVAGVLSAACTTPH